ncbi:hypothetical protein PANO111632_19875 [Paracoccus nototheniae]|uniref:TonB-dependent receptor n=1 Tax=Paracoccus nototheniae TaxID=2489002 RepID=A0ABW4DT69_9RHOB|nr:hypothetical protein [Paracoccus nototheniae]
MSTKTILTALILTTSAAGASTSIEAKDPTDLLPGAAEVQAGAKTKQVPARTVMTGSELARAGISGDTLLTVSAFGIEGQVANLYRDR